MTEAAQNTPSPSNERGDWPAHLATPAATIHENVFGEVSTFVSEHLKGDVVILPEPGTGVYAAVLNGKDGIEKIDPSLWDAYRTNPRYRAGTAQVLDVTSFIAHVNRFKDSESMVFADNSRDKPSLLAVLDYHEAINHHPTDFNPDIDNDFTPVGGVPRFGRHRTQHYLPLSDEWKAWHEADKQSMTMPDFAAFLEDRIIDVLHPSLVVFGDQTLNFVQRLGGVEKIADPARLMELSQSFHVNEQSAVKSAVRLASGETAITFTSEHTDANGQAVNIPSMFAIWIPVFKGEQPQPIIARLRYRLVAGSPRFFYELWRTDLVFDAAFNATVERVKRNTALPVLLGRPEA